MPLGALSLAWISAEAALPLGWKVDSIRRAFTGPDPEHRSDRWLAFAAGPNGEATHSEGGDPVQALNNLAKKLQARRGTMSGRGPDG